MTGTRATVHLRLLQRIIASVGVLLCLYCLWAASAVGLSRLFSASALKTGQLAAADKAASLEASDPRAHLIRAALLKANRRLDEARKEYERAVELRPRDYVLRLELGLALDEMDDREGALAALREAARLAPSYAEPHWQLGNVELRAGQLEEAFAQMRLAATSKPALWPQLIDLAWAAYSGNVPAIEQALKPETQSAQLTLARMAAKRGKPLDAARIFRSVGNVSADDRRALLTEFLNAKQFRTAYEVWASAPEQSGRDAGSGFIDGGFEGKINLSEPGFGWQAARDNQAVQVSVDATQPRSGSKSLRLDWKGEVNPTSPVISQIVLVEPNARYRLRFSARTDQLVTGGTPFIAVVDANDARALVESESFAQRTSPWQDDAVEFTTGKETEAVLIALRRHDCGSGNPCPIFGRVWLDDFSLQKL